MPINHLSRPQSRRQRASVAPRRGTPVPVRPRAKQLAARERKTLRELVDEALRARVLPPPRSRAPFRLQLPTVRGQRPPAVDIADRDALYDLMERE